MEKMTDMQFVGYIAVKSFKLFSSDDARNASSARLIEVVEGDYADFAKKNALNEMRRRVACGDAGMTGYAGCAERFASYLA